MPSQLRRVRSRPTLVLVFAAAVLAAAGCAKSGKVSGKITLADGSPLPGGIITFTPEDSSRNPATAVIREDGTYEADVPTGMCKVGIDNRMAGSKQSPVGIGGAPVPPTGGAAGGAKGGPPNMMAKLKGGAGPPAASKGGVDDIARAAAAAGAPQGQTTIPVPGKVVPINSKYMNPVASGLTFEVRGGSNTFDVQLEK